MTMTIDIMNETVASLISDLEQLKLIRVKSPAPASAGGPLSKRFAGAMKHTQAEYEAMQETLKRERDGWTRDIY
jgi:hypothetical protein